MSRISFALLACAVIFGLGVARIWIAAATTPSVVWPAAGMDLDTYRRAAESWAAGHGFYYPEQLAGPYPVDGTPTLHQPILYPPTALLLFVPFVYLPAILWWVIPLGVTAWVVWSWHPSLAGWALIAALAAGPASVYGVLTGNPALWIVMLVALATRWPAFGPWVLLKPTLLPFALVGAMRSGHDLRRVIRLDGEPKVHRQVDAVPLAHKVASQRQDVGGTPRGRQPGVDGLGEGLGRIVTERVGDEREALLDDARLRLRQVIHGASIDRRWLAGLALFALAGLVFLPMWPDYLTVLRNARSEAGPLYSFGQAPMLLIPLVAWLARARREVDGGGVTTTARASRSLGNSVPELHLERAGSHGGHGDQ